MTGTARIPGRLVVAVSAALLLAGCAGTTPSSEADSDTAAQKATQLQSALAAEGLRVPSADVIQQLYGTDGGVTCTTAESDLATGHATFLFANPSGRRPARIDPKVIAYDEAVLGVYCPQTLQEFQSFVSGWQTAETIPS